MKPIIGIRRLITLAAVIATTAGGTLGLAAAASASPDASYPLPAGCTAPNARSALNYLVRRHEVLRTVYDLQAGGWPRQREPE